MASECILLISLTATKLSSALQAYIDQQLVGSGHCSRAIIVGLNAAVWAASPGLQLAPEEAHKLADAFAGELSPSLFRIGLSLAGVNYQIVRAEGRTLYARHGATGLCAAKTKRCVIVACHTQEMEMGRCACTVERLADHLIECGY